MDALSENLKKNSNKIFNTKTHIGLVPREIALLF